MSSVLLVGRTNAGKSSLFNALIGRSVSVVHNTENLTNDIIKFSNNDFTIYDSPGFENISKFEHFLTRVKEYDTVCIVCDPNDYSHALCKSILSYFKDKECILVINKIDLVRDVSKFGFGDIEVCHVSAINRTGIDKLRQRLRAPDNLRVIQQTPGEISWSIFGRANVGKSSVANLLLGFDRFTVMDKVGTTREINPEDSSRLGVTLIDTPGYRKNNGMDELDKASQYRLEDYINKSPGGFAIFVIDASEGFMRTDRLIIDKILDKFSLFFVINKVDLVSEVQLQNIEVEICRMHANVDYVFLSSKTRFGYPRLLALIRKMRNMRSTKISTPKLNKWLQTQQNRHIKYITQKDFNSFILFSKRQLNQPQIRYLENSIARNFDIRGTRLKFEIRG